MTITAYSTLSSKSTGGLDTLVAAAIALGKQPYGEQRWNANLAQYEQVMTSESDAVGAGSVATAAASYVTAAESSNGPLHQTVLTLADLPQDVVNGTEYQGTKIYDFPIGRILVLGVTASLQQKTTSTILTTLNGGSTGAVALGTAVASSTTLASTMANLLPSTAFTSSATIDVAGTAVGAALAASAQFDGTATAVDVYLNSAYATTGDVDADATQTFSGTVTLTWMQLGDY